MIRGFTHLPSGSVRDPSKRRKSIGTGLGKDEVIGPRRTDLEHSD